MLDYALDHTPYITVNCKSCKGKGCESCDGTGKVKKENTNYYAKAATARLRVFDRELQLAEWCYKVRARTAELDAAFEPLLKEGAAVVAKWSDPSNTAMEADDAHQLAYRGLLDAADHFDPSLPHAYLCPKCGYTLKVHDDLKAKGIKKKDYFDTSGVERSRPCPAMITNEDGEEEPCGLKKMMVVGPTASFKTYSYKWVYRYTRVRKDGEARPGIALVPDTDKKGKTKLVSTVSIDDPKKGQDEDGAGLSDQIASDGSLGGTIVPTKGELATDVHQQIAALTDPLHRAVMELQLQNFSLSEMGDKLGINPKTVGKIRAQAFEVLKTKLANYA